MERLLLTERGEEREEERERGEERGREGEGERGNENEEGRVDERMIERMLKNTPLLLLPMPHYIKDFEGYFNSSLFSDLSFVFDSHTHHPRIIMTHKVVLSRSLPFRNYLLKKGADFHQILVPSFVSFSFFASFLQSFYYDQELLVTKKGKLSPEEESFISELFGKMDPHGVIPSRPLREHFPSLVGVQRFSDGALVRSSGSPVPIHRLLLSIRSDFFSRAFSGKLKEGASGEVSIPDLGDEIVKILLGFMYYDQEAKGGCLSPENVLEVLYVADRLQMNDLKELCIEEICSGFQEGTVDSENVLHILEASYSLHIPRLRHACLSLAISNFFKIQDQEEFINLPSQLQRELKELAHLQKNPLGSKAICYAKEMVAMLKESLEIQESRLSLVREQFQAKKSALEQEEHSLSEEILQGRLLFLEHWRKLIDSQEKRVSSLRNYISNHEVIFDSFSSA